MKKDIFLPVLTLIVVCLSCQRDAGQDDDYSRIKSVKENVYEAKVVDGVIQKGTPIGSYFDNSLTEYDSSGNIVKQMFFFSDGTLSMQYDFHYDEDRLVKQNIYDDQHNIIYLYKFVYDEMGNMCEKTMLDPDGQIVSRIVSCYDENKEIEQVRYNSQGESVNKQLFYYDESDNLVKKDLYGGTDKIVSTYLYDYDQFGNKIEESLLRAGEYLDYLHVFTYDEAHNVVKEEYYGKERELTGYLICFYDDENRMVKKCMFDQDSNVIQNNIFEYNVDGQLVEHLRTSQGSDYITTYIYNQPVQDYWVKRIDFSSKTPVKITIRENEYYSLKEE
jgi:hypothetical protein